MQPGIQFRKAIPRDRCERHYQQCMICPVAHAGARASYCLAWKFEMDLYLLVNTLVQESGVKGKPFTRNWQDYRTHKDRNLKTISDAGFIYPTPGKSTACVKDMDTFSCDTYITLKVEV